MFLEKNAKMSKYLHHKYEDAYVIYQWLAING